MSERTGGQLASDALRDEGVKTVFGLLGSATMELLDGLYDEKGIRYIGVRDERTGTHMADGYARVSGQPGVMIAGQNGPGVTNLVTGVAQALRAYSPVVTIGGALSRSHQYREGFQDLDQQGLLAAVTKRTYSASTTDMVYRLIRDAFRVALAPRRGPVHVNLPRDVLAGSATAPPVRLPIDRSRPAGLAAATQSDINAAADLLARAARPFIVVGGGVKWEGRNEEALALAQLLGCPIGASAGHGDAIPTRHALSIGQVGPRGNPVATKALAEADVLLLLGTRLGFNSTMFAADSISADAAVIHVDQDATVFGREFPCTVGIAADAPTVAGQLTAHLAAHVPPNNVTSRAQQFAAAYRELWEEREQTGTDKSMPLQPGRVFAALRHVLPLNTIFTLDAGTMCLQATDVLEHAGAPSLLTPLDFGLVGFSFAAGLGAKLAAPDRPVVSLIGDGGFGMTLTELATAVAEDIDTTVVVLDNGVWGAEKSYQRDFFGGRYIGSDLHNPPFEKIAELYGAAGYRVGAADEVEDVVKLALSDGRPSVVVVPMDPDAMVSFRRDSFAHRSGSAQ
jgi:thiamine pyrophosphate-dependent acetolactate synthase large subunit-like protein